MYGYTRAEGTVPDPQFHRLTDSLAGCIRWRLLDYEAMLKAEVALMLNSCDSRQGTRVGPATADGPRAAADGPGGPARRRRLQ